MRVRPPSADEFTDERMLRPAAEPPRAGLRRLLFHVSRGHINLGPTAAELRERDLIARAKAPVSGCRHVAVMTRKGGATKTTTTLCLGHTFATHRGDKVVALDGNPDAGNLAERGPRQTTKTITDLLKERDGITRYADMAAFVNQTPSRLEVVAADSDPRIAEALTEDDYEAAMELLDFFYNLVLLDTGTGVLSSANKGILRLADQLVVVSSASLDAARRAYMTLDWLEQNGHANLARRSVFALSEYREHDGKAVDLDEVEAHFRARCRDTVRIPMDPHLGPGAQISLERLSPATRDAYLELAAKVADDFALEP